MEPTAAKKKVKKLKSSTKNGELSRHDDMLRTHYPKRCPTYLVAFSLKETYDDLATAQQMICKHSTPKHSPQPSTNSITPTGSFKILEPELDESNLIANNKRSRLEHSPQKSSNSITATGSFKVLEPELGESNLIANNKRSRLEHSSQKGSNSITATGSFKTLETELDESSRNAKNKRSNPEHSPQESINSMTPTGSFIIPETEPKGSGIIIKTRRSSLDYSPQESTNTITPTGSLKVIETELDKSDSFAKSNSDNNAMGTNSQVSVKPKHTLKVLETEATSVSHPILDKKYSEKKLVSIENSQHASISSRDSSTPTSSLQFSSSDYSSASRITIGEKQKVAIDFTAFGTNSDEPSTTECSNISENVMKSDLVAQNIKNKDFSQDQREGSELTQNKEKTEKFITVIVYDESDNISDKDKMADTDNMGYIVNTGKSDDTRNSSNMCDINNKDVDDVNYNKLNDDTNLTQEIRKNNKEPESIFKAVRKNRAPRKKRSFRRKSNNVVNIKQKKFKCKLTKKKIDTRLEKYYEKRNNSIGAHQIQLDLYSDEVSTVVSRTKVVHKKARENLLEHSDFNTFSSDFDDERSLTSSLSTARKTLMSVSDSSQNTLVQEPSTISNVTDILDMIKTNQDIEVDHVSSLLKMPNVNDVYKSEVISIPVTVAYDRLTVLETKNEKNALTSQETSEEIFTLVKLPLTSCAEVLPLISNAMYKTEQSSDIFDNVTIESSNKTLKNMNSSFVQLSSDDFYNARTSSQFSKCIDSYSTLTNDRNTVIGLESTTEDSTLNKEAMIFETVINLNRCDETPSTSSNTHSSDDLPYFNDIIVANVPNDKHLPYQSHSDNKDKEKENNRRTILIKTTDKPTEKVPNKMMNLPNQLQIKAMLRERETPQLKCGDEMRHPANIPPIWERLMAALEVAVHRLEDNLVEKIMNEIHKSVKYSEPKPPGPELTSKAEQAATAADCENLSVQCEIVKNATIDKIMGILSNDGPKIKEPSTLHKVDLYNDIEVIISPDTTRAMTEKGDQITISTLTSDSLKLHHRLSCLASVPVSFIRENMLVITSVPTFFVFLLCLYGLIQFLMKPLW